MRHVQLEPTKFFNAVQPPCAHPLRRVAMSQETLQDFAGVWIGKISEVVKAVTGSGPIKYLINWSRMYALWPVHITTACCSAEFGAMMGPRLDPERFGLQAVAGGLRQCDLLIVEGTVT